MKFLVVVPCYDEEKRLLVNEFRAFIEKKFISSNDHQRFWTFKILAKILGSSAVKYFSKFIKEVPDDEKISLYAVSNLGEIDDPRVIKSLLNFLKTDSFLIREQVFRSLCKVFLSQIFL